MYATFATGLAAPFLREAGAGLTPALAVGAEGLVATLAEGTAGLADVADLKYVNINK